MKKTRHNPYNIEHVAKKYNISLCESKKKIDELKSKTSGSLSTYIKRYGEIEGKNKYKEFCNKSANTEEKFKSKFGKEWREHYKKYLKTKDSTSLEYHIKKYGEIEGKIKYDLRIKSIKSDLNSLIEKYGEIEGTKRYNSANLKRSINGNTTALIKKFGAEKTLAINKSKARVGKNNGMYGKPSPTGSGNGWSGWFKGHHFRSILELSYMIYLDNNNIEIVSAESKEYEIKYKLNDIDRTYRADFVVNGCIVEIKPIRLVNTLENKAKFEAARKKFGYNFKVITDNDIEKIKDIRPLVESGDITLTKRYKDKLDENYKH